jgi:hypothetical protein
VRVTPLRVSAAVIATGSLVIGVGLLVGDSPTPSTTAPVVVDLEIVPHPGDAPQVVRGAPGSREQITLFGGLVVALGTLGVVGSYSAQAARNARDEREEREERDGHLAAARAPGAP